MTQPCYPFFWGDYSAKTHHLTQCQHGAYIMLLRYIYTSGKLIPDEHRYSIARASSEQERSDTDFVLSSFFILESGFWRNEKASVVMVDAAAKHQARVNAGRKGGCQKASNATVELDQRPNKALPTTITTTVLSEDKSSSRTVRRRVTLEDLSVEHISDWLAEKRSRGRYIDLDERHVLEVFKDYCRSKGKSYADYAAGLRNAFDWDRFHERKDKHHPTKDDRARAAVLRGLGRSD